MSKRTILWLLASAFVACSGHVAMPSTFTARLDITWSTPITTDMTAQGTLGRSQGLVLVAGALRPDGTPVFLGQLHGPQDVRSVLLLDAEKTKPGGAVPLPLPMPDPPGPQFTGTWLFRKQRPNRNPGVSTLTTDEAGNVWLGGSTNHYMGVASDSHSDAYLAKLDAAGRLVWGQAYGQGRTLVARGIAPTADGGAVVVGPDLLGSWAARIAADGKMLAGHTFGTGDDTAVAPLGGGRFLIAGFASRGEAATHQDDVAIWLLDAAGELRGPTVVRQAISRDVLGRYGRLTASPTTGGAYVASNWGEATAP